MDLKRSRPGAYTNGRGGPSSKRAADGSGGRSSGGTAGPAADEPIADDLIEDAIDLGDDDAMEDADFDEAAGFVVATPDGEDVQLGEAGRNWERPPPPTLNPRSDALGTHSQRFQTVRWGMACPPVRLSLRTHIQIMGVIE